MRIPASIETHGRFAVEAATAYMSSAALTLYGFIAAMDWQTLLASTGGLVLFIARAAVDIPKAIDYWKERKKKK